MIISILACAAVPCWLIVRSIQQRRLGADSTRILIQEDLLALVWVVRAFAATLELAFYILFGVVLFFVLLISKLVADLLIAAWKTVVR